MGLSFSFIVLVCYNELDGCMLLTDTFVSRELQGHLVIQEVMEEMVKRLEKKSLICGLFLSCMCYSIRINMLS